MASQGGADGSEGSGTHGPERDDDAPVAGPRDVEVPLRVYKAVTVFSTLFAVAAVVGGFVALDAATDRARAPPSEVDPFLAIGAVALIVVGAAVYAFSTRFRARGMGKAKDESNEPSGNG